MRNQVKIAHAAISQLNVGNVDKPDLVGTHGGMTPLLGSSTYGSGG